MILDIGLLILGHPVYIFAYSVYPQLRRSKHWWGISSYQRAGGTSRRADEQIPQHFLWKMTRYTCSFYCVWSHNLIMNSLPPCDVRTIDSFLLFFDDHSNHIYMYFAKLLTLPLRKCNAKVKVDDYNFIDRQLKHHI